MPREQPADLDIDDEDLDEDGEPDVQWYPPELFPPEIVAAMMELEEEEANEA